MTDQEFLLWLHERLSKHHGVNELNDFMHRFRSIIYHYPTDKKSSMITCNSYSELSAMIKMKKAKNLLETMEKQQ